MAPRHLPEPPSAPAKDPGEALFVQLDAAAGRAELEEGEVPIHAPELAPRRGIIDVTRGAAVGRALGTLESKARIALDQRIGAAAHQGGKAEQREPGDSHSGLLVGMKAARGRQAGGMVAVAARTRSTKRPIISRAAAWKSARVQCALRSS